ncbi:MAG TPA: HNH endonuclease signature motif containing protein, partial [Pseudonocardiaceae bacterium]
RWCAAHHITHWADGGPTNLTNVVLLCGRHHRLVHHSDWDCAIVDGHAKFYPPTYIDPSRRPRRNTMHQSAA